MMMTYTATVHWTLQLAAGSGQGIADLTVSLLGVRRQHSVERLILVAMSPLWCCRAGA
jgi:ABC-type Fe3+-siderophore transport system permease subunit